MSSGPMLASTIVRKRSSSGGVHLLSTAVFISSPSARALEAGGWLAPLDLTDILLICNRTSVDCGGVASAKRALRAALFRRTDHGQCCFLCCRRRAYRRGRRV